MSTAGEKVDRFLAKVSAHPETRPLGMALVPYRALASGGAEDLVETIDLLAQLWTEAKSE